MRTAHCGDVVYGIDFTSAPSGHKPITRANCVLTGHQLAVQQVDRLPTFEDFEEALSASGPWTMAIDFPFGQPRELIELLDWPREWKAYVGQVEERGKQVYEAELRAIGRRFHRHTDRICRSLSPMQLDFTPVGKMFFQGAPRLLHSGVTVVPMHDGDHARTVLEAYPKLVANVLLRRVPYKSDDPRKQTIDRESARESIVRALPNLFSTYGVHLTLAAGIDGEAIGDPSGDTLDAMLCAVQAAWAWQRRHNNYGVPSDCDIAEGWIADPASK